GSEDGGEEVGGDEEEADEKEDADESNEVEEDEAAVKEDAVDEETGDMGDEENKAQPDEPPSKKRHADAMITSKIKKRQKRLPNADSEYGVSRGVDFRRVRAVINLDLPTTSRSYTHRVGRTARGVGNKGWALSFVVPADKVPELPLPKKKGKGRPAEEVKIPLGARDEEVLARIKRAQERAGRKVEEFVFDMGEVEAFRYRVEDAMRAVTKTAVREARLKEIRQEILNSEKLKAHFEDNPRDLQALRHDRPLHPSRIQSHMNHVPDYLMPKRDGRGAAASAGSSNVPFKMDGRRKRGTIAGRVGRGRGRGSALSLSAAAKRQADPLKSFKSVYNFAE
ncbi:ATP-dependent DNA/RNA helicase, partial [Irineochytrium annulatum]